MHILRPRRNPSSGSDRLAALQPLTVEILFLTDRLSRRGGADQHLLQVIDTATSHFDRVTIAFGRREREVTVPAGARLVRIKGLAAAVERDRGLAGLDALLDPADLVHLQNVMNPAALRRAVATGRAVITVQDHRVFCPGPGRTRPDGSRCQRPMSFETCTDCLEDGDYRTRLLELTRSRLKALAGARRLVVLSRYMAEELGAVGLGPIEVVPPQVTSHHARAEGAAGRGVLLGGRLVRHKGVGRAVRAWRRAATGQPLRVAGAGPLEAELGLQGVERLGWLSAAALRRELGQARMVLFPSRWQEPFGILGVEALAEGAPVVVAATGGTSEWTEAGCLVVDPLDEGAMAEAIRALASDPTLATRLGRRGRALVLERFAPEVVEAKLTRVWRAVADQ